MTPPLPFTPIHLSEFGKDQPLKWIIKKLLPRTELAIIYGESGCGKTFAALQIAMCIARGEAWNGLKTNAGRVLYMCAEGSSGFRNRVQAYAMRHNLNLEDIHRFFVIKDAPNFLEQKDMTLLTSALALHGPVDVIFIDTLARVIPGANENAGEDMGPVIAFCQVIHKLTGALIVFIHHAGKDTSKGARGWSGIKGACDTELEVTKSDNNHKIRLSKQRDGADGMEWGFNLIQYEIGRDEDEEPITSCYYEDTEVAAKAKFERKLGGWQGTVMATLKKALEGESNSFVLEEVLVELTVQNSASPPKNERDTRRQHIRRAITSLVASDMVQLKDGKVLLKQ